MRQAAPRRGEIPADREAERAVLAAALIDESHASREGVLSSLRPEDFFWEEHRLVWGAIQECVRQRMPVTYVTVTYQARELGTIDRLDQLADESGMPGAEVLLVSLTSRHFSGIGCSAFAWVVKDYAERREQINRGAKMVREGYQGQTKLGWVK